MKDIVRLYTYHWINWGTDIFGTPFILPQEGDGHPKIFEGFCMVLLYPLFLEFLLGAVLA